MSSSNCSRCSMVILDGECSVCRGAVDWPAFWRSLPPREAWEAAKAMPKIAGAWWVGPMSEQRADPSGRAVAWSVCDRRSFTTIVGYQTIAGPMTKYPDRASADAALRAAGWVLCDEEGT